MLLEWFRCLHLIYGQLSNPRFLLKLTFKYASDVAALLRSHMIGLLPFESTIEQTTETMPLSLKQ